MPIVRIHEEMSSTANAAIVGASLMIWCTAKVAEILYVMIVRNPNAARAKNAAAHGIIEI